MLCIIILWLVVSTINFYLFLIFLLQYYHITNFESQIYYIIQGFFLKEDPYYPDLAGYVKIS